MEEHKVNPSSRFTYELNAQGYVIHATEEYTPEYMEYVGTNVGRVKKYIEYEYIFEK